MSLKHIHIPKNINAKFELIPNTGIGWKEIGHYLLILPSVGGGLYLLPIHIFAQLGLGIFFFVLFTGLLVLPAVRGCNVKAGAYFRDVFRFYKKKKKKQNILLYKKVGR
ncbi:hypothetical protein COK81_04670 [Bacillus thuringiensis]|uniref:Uncharacterized protein n=1 Tax=Bacillus thuringiensis TaxID=1428 RepID=A0A9X7B3K5_BACTU|nr:hypothetical protein [Bacillus thuringiensis]PFT98681.1 hypothetical protein COK81_04670 [Bacillus thuringiensis]